MCEFNVYGKVISVHKIPNKDKEMAVVRMAYQFKTEQGMVNDKVNIMFFAPLNTEALKIPPGEMAFIQGRMAEKKLPDAGLYPQTILIGTHVSYAPKRVSSALSSGLSQGKVSQLGYA